MSTSNINDEMRQAAEYAIKIGSERFGKQLDYSESSLPSLESIVEQAHQQFAANKAAGKNTSETGLNRTASIWGSYLGELIRKKSGGTWIIKESKRWMLVNNYKFSPIEYVYQRINGQLLENVNQYFDEVVEMLSSQQTSLVQPQNINKDKNKSSSIERILQIVLGVAVLCLLVGVASWLFSSQISGPTKAAQQAANTQEAANIIATANQRFYKTPTKIPSSTPAHLVLSPTSIPTDTAVPTNTPFFPNLPPVPINEQNYRWIINPQEFIANPNSYKNKRVHFDSYVKRIVNATVDGKSQVILTLSSAKGGSYVPVLVFGLIPNYVRFTDNFDFGFNSELTIYGVGMGKVDLQILTKLFNGGWLLPDDFLSISNSHFEIPCLYGESYYVLQP